MRLKSLHVKNFCQHSDRSIEFPSGLTIITGRNGVGKSNLFVEAPRFAFLSETYNTGSKQNDLKYGTKEGFVEVQFYADNKLWTLKRSLHRNSCILTNDKGFKEKKTKVINDLILELFSLPTRVINEMIFMRQEHITRLLFDTPAMREKELQHFFGTIICEYYREQLQNYISSISITDYKNEKDFYKQEQQRIEANIKEVKQTRDVYQKQLNEFISKYDTLSNLQQKLADLQVLYNQKQDKQKLQEELSNLQQRYNEVISKLSDIDVNIKKCEFVSKQENIKIYENLKQKYNQALILHNEYQTNKQLLESTKQKYQNLKQAIKDIEANYPDLNTIDNIHKELISIENDMNLIYDFLNNSGAEPKCPFCGTVFTQESYKQLCEKRKEDYNKLSRRFEELRKKYKEYTTIKTKYENLTKEFSFVEAELRKLQGKFQNIKLPDMSILENKIKKFENAQQEYNKFKNLSDQLNVEKNYLTKQLQEYKTRLDSIKDAECDTTKLIELKQIISQMENLEKEVSKCNYKIEELEKSLISIQKRYKEVEEKEKQIDNLIRFKNDLQFIRDVLHRDKYPRRVAIRYLNKLQGVVNKYLSAFSCPFEFVISEDLEFLCNFRDTGITLPATRLSGGEKVMLSIAYRFASMELYSSHIDFIILDEPTIYLDEFSVENLAGIIQSLNVYAKEFNKQILIITHEEALVSYADNHIHLSD